MDSGSENGGLLPPLLFRGGVLVSLDSMYLIDLSSKNVPMTKKFKL